MGRVRELSDIKLALLLAAATCLGGFGATFLDHVMLDASTSRETDVQIVQLAIGVLGEELDQSDEANTLRDRALRTWAVDTLNAVADIKLPPEARTALIEGVSSFRSMELARELVTIPGIGSRDELIELISSTANLTFHPKTGNTEISLEEQDGEKSQQPPIE